VEVLGVIPARGGSKGIPHKNLAPLGGRPLIAHTVDAARASRRLTRTVVSTDDPEIARAARALAVEVPFLRPAHLGADDTSMVDVLVDLVATLEARERYRSDLVVLLQPTSPFRRAEHVDSAVDLLASSGADSVVTVVPVPHHLTPTSLMCLDGDRLRPWSDGSMPTRRQDKPRLFARNGPAVVVVRTRVLMEQRTLYGPDTRGLVMARQDSLDIDDTFDLAVAELLITTRPAARSGA
jgi:CMP-N,N'-diacetyllegionaminic acid synthase